MLYCGSWRDTHLSMFLEGLKLPLGTRDLQIDIVLTSLWVLATEHDTIRTLLQAQLSDLSEH